MKPNYTVEIYTPQDLNHSSYIHTGLFKLEEQGLIQCHIKWDISKKMGRISTENGTPIVTNFPQTKTSYYKLIDHSTLKTYFFATDLFDVPFSFSKYALDHCDYIFKRNYVPKYINSLNSQHSKKISPMGLTLGVQLDQIKYEWVFKAAHLISNILLNLKFDRMLFYRLNRTMRKSLKHWKYVTEGRGISQLINTSESNQLNIFYQVRCFPGIIENHVKKINNQRAYLIRALKKNFDSFFYGGLVPDEVAHTLYKDCVTNLPTNPVEYLKLMNESSICIYTNGLRGSPARKISEYMAKSKCIVAEKFEAQLPVPIRNGVEVMFFETPEECVSICEKLLNDEEKVKLLSANAKSYFDNNIYPTKNVKRILELMLQKPLES